MTQREQRELAALLAIVYLCDEHHVFDLHHHEQDPEDERQRSEDAVGALCRRQAVETFAQRIKRAGPDIAEHGAECAHDRQELRGPRPGRRRFGIHRSGSIPNATVHSSGKQFTFLR